MLGLFVYVFGWESKGRQPWLARVVLPMKGNLDVRRGRSVAIGSFPFRPEMRHVQTHTDWGRGRTIETVEIPFLSQRHSKIPSGRNLVPAQESGPRSALWWALFLTLPEIVTHLQTNWKQPEWEMEKDRRRGWERKSDGKKRERRLDHRMSCFD